MTCILFVGEDSILPFQLHAFVFGRLIASPTILIKCERAQLAPTVWQDENCALELFVGEDIILPLMSVDGNMRADMESAPTFGDNMVWLPLGGRF